jgi:hypothetical protein
MRQLRSAREGKRLKYSWKLTMEKGMQRLIDDPETALRRAADHVLKGYAWFYSDRKVTVPAAAMLTKLADEILLERTRWLAILARN